MVANYEYYRDEINADQVDIEAIKLIPADYAFENTVLPIKVENNTMIVVLGTKTDKTIINTLKFITKKDIVCYVAEDELLKRNIKAIYEVASIKRAVEDLKLDLGKETKKHISEDTEIVNAPAVKLVESLLNKAISEKASDIHIEPEERDFRIRYRIDGSLINVFTLPKEIYNNIVTRIKVMCNMDISEKRIPQDGNFTHNFENSFYDMRVSSIPTVNDEKIVIRILDRYVNYLDINKIYFEQQQKSMIDKILKHNHGIILATGPTGSGKSTTLYAMLKELNKNNINITTIEEPVEYMMKGINQINVNNKAGITFARGLRSILRQDPDVIMIGEIRDEETAAIAIRAAITGHLVLSTVHTNSAFGTINRLAEMGVERYLLADAIIAVIAQRLVKKLCTFCRKEYKPSEYEARVLNLNNDNVKLYRGEGCSKCHYTGYRGRVPVSEIMYVDDSVKQAIIKETLYNDHTVNNDMINNCVKLVLNGLTTTDELIKVANGDIF
ncbi:GspE/PulE family protein [Clostridium oryzae]|uniref:Type II secretion system protein E n=1 Tax=Clostridium oryzae TaxID=1450648 RepID=A0A1V4IT86_9CLOT|nr:GspE/PulE family protein [Clostridium oryzae]OPJ63222.1 type II secretion system protein E [Clostridium oryzae]